MKKIKNQNQEPIKNFLLPMPVDLHKKLKLYSIETEKMIRDLICEAIKDYLKARKVL